MRILLKKHGKWQAQCFFFILILFSFSFFTYATELPGARVTLSRARARARSGEGGNFAMYVCIFFLKFMAAAKSRELGEKSREARDVLEFT